MCYIYFIKLLVTQLRSSLTNSLVGWKGSLNLPGSMLLRSIKELRGNRIKCLKAETL